MRLGPFIALLTLLSAPALADTVHLASGGSFEGVLAEVSGNKVLIRMQGGTVSVPRSQVVRIESGDSSFAQYLQRRDALNADPSASGWLDLARWAQGKGLAQASREAALTAARIDPKLSGLEAVLRPLGFVLDEALGRWIPYDESMRRKGFVQSNGVWITRAELDAAQRAWEAEREQLEARRAERLRAAREDRLAELATLALAREARRTEAPPVPYYPPAVIVIPGYFPPVPAPQDPGGSPQQPPAPQPREEERNRSTFTRVPGSLIPGQYPGTWSRSGSPRP